MKTQKLTVLLVIALAGSLSAGDYVTKREVWPESVQDWRDRDGTGPDEMVISWDPEGQRYGGALKGDFAEQFSIPFPEIDAFLADTNSSLGRFTGDYLAWGGEPESLYFDVKALDVLPSHLLVRLNGNGQSFFRQLTDQLDSTGVWRRIELPLDYASGQWTGGDAGAFSNLLQDVQSLEIQFARAGTGNQAFKVDNFSVLWTVPDALLSVDTDGDGLPDFWEEAFFGNATVAEPGTDSDGDGLSNAGELAAGTDPRDAMSMLLITAFGMSPTGAVLEFDSSLGRTYVVESTGNMASGQWSTASGTVPGNGLPINVSATNVPGKGYFRIRANRP